MRTYDSLHTEKGKAVVKFSNIFWFSILLIFKVLNLGFPRKEASKLGPQKMILKVLKVS